MPNIQFCYNTDGVKSILSRFGIYQLVDVCTRITLQSATTIDYVLTNYNNNMTIRIRDSPKISDHSIISVNLFKRVNAAVDMYTNATVKKVVRRLNQDKLDTINMQLIMESWPLSSTDVNLILQDIVTKCENIIKHVALEQTLHNGGRFKLPWYDVDVKNLVRDRDNAYKNIKSADLLDKNISWERYRVLRNKFVETLKLKKKEYFNN